MTPFDPIRAQREVIAGLVEVHKVIKTRDREAERRLAEAEADHNALAKIERFIADLIMEAREKLEDLEEVAGGKTQDSFT
jgi:t-SNARE complex subunit (syntaxin)